MIPILCFGVLMLVSPALAVDIEQVTDCCAGPSDFGYSSPAWSQQGELAYTFVYSDLISGWGVVQFHDSGMWIPPPSGHFAGDVSLEWNGQDRAAFVTTDLDPGLWVWSPGGTVQRITESYARSPSWNRSGGTVLWVADGDLWIQPVLPDFVPPMPAQRIAVQGVARSASWGPDGRVVYEAGGDLWILQSRRGDVTQLTSGDAQDRDPAWSSDGRWIAFSSNRGGDVDIWLITTSGDRALQLTHDTDPDTEPTWAPDGRLAFTSTHGGGHNIFVASNLDDLTPVEDSSWSAMKSLYR